MLDDFQKKVQERVNVLKEDKFVFMIVFNWIWLLIGKKTLFALQVLDCTLNFIEGCYAIPNVKIEGRLCKTNTVSNTSFRGFGIPQAYVAMETIIDHVAHVLKIGSKQVKVWIQILAFRLRLYWNFVEVRKYQPIIF